MKGFEKVTCYFVKSGELYIDITRLSFTQSTQEYEILNLIIQKGIYVIAIKRE